jgi:hypothetical protein
MASISVELTFKKDTGRYLVAERDEREYWFEKSTLESCEVDREDVTIAIEERLWTRRLKTERPEVKAFYKMRKCLCCKSMFKAEKQMFVCDPCKNSYAWREGNNVFAI